MSGTVGICLYGLVLIALTLGLLRTREFTKKQVIFLAIAWLPFVIWGILLVFSFGTLVGGGNFFSFLLAWLIMSSPLLVIIGAVVLVMWLMAKWRG